MKVRALGAVALGAAVFAVGGVASAAAPQASGLTLLPADMAGAKLKAQGAVKEAGYVSAHQRSYQYAKPSKAGIVFVQSEAAVAPSTAKATKDLADARRAFASKAGRKAFVAIIASSAGVKAKAVTLGAIRGTRVGDGGFEITVSLKLGKAKVYESLAYFRLDAVLETLVQAGVRPVSPASTAAYENLIAAHIGAALAPVDVAPPTVSGTPQAGQTLTAAPGTWDGAAATYAYQWQRCDAAGANCADVPGATASTYVLTDADRGFTFRINVTATNAYGTAAAPSALTAVVT